MHSRKQLKSLKRKTATKTKVVKPLVNKQFTKIVPRLSDNGNLEATAAMAEGGPFAAVKVINALGVTLVDRPADYSFCTDPINSENKKELKNKNILTNEQVNQENEKISTNEYFSDPNGPIFVPDIEKRPIKKSIKNRVTNDPNINIKVDLSELVMGLYYISTPEKNNGQYVDQDFIKIGRK